MRYSAPAMATPSEGPDTDLAYELYFSGLKAQLTRLALLLDVFSPLAAGPASADQVARACGCDPEGVRLLLDYLAALGLLERRDGLYGLTSTARAFMVPASRSYAGDVMLTFTAPGTWDSIQQVIRTGHHAEIETERDHAQDAWIESHSQWRTASAAEMWRKAGVEARRPDGLAVLDVACGCAIKSFVLAQGDPAVRVTCLDRPTVLAVARDLAGRMGVLDQAEFRADDLLTADLGESAFDACLLGQVTHYLTVEQNRALMARLHTALRPGGTLVIDVPMTRRPVGADATADDAPVSDASASLLSLLLWAGGGSRVHAFEDYRDWLSDAGFRDVRRPGERWLAADRPR